MDLTGVILLTGIGLVVGFLVAALIFSMKREPADQEQSKEKLLSDAENRVRLWRIGGDERLVVEMNGVSYQQVGKMKSEQRQVLSKLVSELQAFLGASVSEVTGVLPEEEKSKPPKLQPVEAQDRTSLNPLKIFGDALQPRKKTDGGAEELSIVAQIDQILQSRLEGTNLEEQGIRLVEGPDQDMVIEIGLDRYTEIDAVPDEEVREMIRLSVADWESSLGD